ncbi:MAG: SRPBCC family protein [Acidobacteriota bacterium]|nr:SRPBCC family protein [Acidobacteriota bacterium]
MNSKRSALLAMLMAPAVFGGEFEPVSVAHSGTFDLDVPPEKAFHLFTAPGETLWVPHWHPVILSGDGTEAGTVFVTRHGDETTIWVVVDFDSNQHRARYARLTPASRAGTVEVRVQPNDRGGSTVAVRYELTALTESGNENLAGFDAGAYSKMLKEWEALIRAADIDYQAHFAQ